MKGYCVLALGVTALLAQSPAADQTRPPGCEKAKPGQACRWTIDKNAPVSIGTLRLRNRTTAEIEVTNATPFDVCQVARERKAIEPEASALAALLDTIRKFAGVIGFGVARALPVPGRERLGERAKVNDLAQRFLDKIDTANRAADQVQGELKAISDEFTRVRQNYERLHSSPGGGATEETKKQDHFRATREELVERIAALNQLQPNVVVLKLELAGMAELRKDKAFPELGADVIDEINSSMSHLYGRLAELEASIAVANDTRKRLAELGDQLSRLRIEFDRTVARISDTDAQLSLTVSCTDAISKDVTLDKTYATFIFRGLPRTALSLGLLVSTVDSVQIGKTDRRADNAAGFETVFAETDHRDVQVVPFSFYNLRLIDLRLPRWGGSVNLAGGFGINPNSGSTEPEFFAGAAIGIGSIYVYGGCHWGREASLGGNFKLNAPVPNNVTVPVNRAYQPGAAFGLSYRIPVP